MKLRIGIVAAFIFTTLTAHAKPLEFRTLTCAHMKYPMTAIADTVKGEIKFFNYIQETIAVHLTKLEVRKTDRQIIFLNPNAQAHRKTVLIIMHDAAGFGTAISYNNENSDEISHYKCTGN